MLYRQYASVDDLNHQYNPSLTLKPGALTHAEHMEQRRAVSARARESLDCALGVRYGPTVDERLDVFPAREDGAPVHVFIHGGYWRAAHAEDFSFLAPALVDAGFTAVVVNYSLCPKVTIGEIVRQVRAAIAWTWRHAAEYRGDPARITVSGHSAGGHLTATSLATDWEGEYGLPADAIKAGCAISGLFDLAPFPYTYIQPWLQLTAGDVHQYSPIRHVRRVHAPLVVVVGGDESEEFHRQGREFLDQWQTAGNEGSWLNPGGLNHFAILDSITEEGSEMHRVITGLAEL